MCLNLWRFPLISLIVCDCFCLSQHSLHCDSSCYCSIGSPVFTGHCGWIQRSLCCPASCLQTGTEHRLLSNNKARFNLFDCVYNQAQRKCKMSTGIWHPATLKVLLQGYCFRRKENCVYIRARKVLLFSLLPCLNTRVDRLHLSCNNNRWLVTAEQAIQLGGVSWMF